MERHMPCRRLAGRHIDSDRIALLSGKASYRAVCTGLSADRYVDRPVEIDRRWSISAIGGRFRSSQSIEGERRRRGRRGRKIPRARCSSPVPPRGPSPARSVAHRRFLLPVRGEGTKRPICTMHTARYQIPYRTKINLSRVAERHFLDLSKKYGSVLAVDLVNTLKSASCSRYVHFDFHQICGHIHFERLSLLYNQIEDYLNKHGYAVCLAIF
ncbi:hypothetical protein BHM03_00002025 [Ensete ventricosum]|nr:hypothetical protein BHM03_00002025 [Ensete ventricosum]